jgi:hypothetical protein
VCPFLILLPVRQLKKSKIRSSPPPYNHVKPEKIVPSDDDGKFFGRPPLPSLPAASSTPRGDDGGVESDVHKKCVFLILLHVRQLKIKIRPLPPPSSLPAASSTPRGNDGGVESDVHKKCVLS